MKKFLCNACLCIFIGLFVIAPLTWIVGGIVMLAISRVAPPSSLRWEFILMGWGFILGGIYLESLTVYTFIIKRNS
jgi:hypothetical protein